MSAPVFTRCSVLRTDRSLDSGDIQRYTGRIGSGAGIPGDGSDGGARGPRPPTHRTRSALHPGVLTHADVSRCHNLT
eukprot:9295410-Pyramimonas_sp.AAC.1